jgi:hypothetical protein
MAFIDILCLILCFYIVASLRSLLPCNVVPLVSTSFEKADTLLQHAEDVNIPYVSEYRGILAMYACLYPLVVSLTTGQTQSGTPILMDTYGEPLLSEVFSTALSLWSDLETVCPQITNRCY